MQQSRNAELVCKLNKAIYGLKQVLRVWFEKLNASLIKFGYNLTKSDDSIFTKFDKVE